MTYTPSGRANRGPACPFISPVRLSLWSSQTFLCISFSVCKGPQGCHNATKPAAPEAPLFSPNLEGPRANLFGCLWQRWKKLSPRGGRWWSPDQGILRHRLAELVCLSHTTGGSSLLGCSASHPEHLLASTGPWPVSANWPGLAEGQSSLAYQMAQNETSPSSTPLVSVHTVSLPPLYLSSKLDIPSLGRGCVPWALP